MTDETKIHHCAIHSLKKNKGGQFSTETVNTKHNITKIVTWLVDELTKEYDKRPNKAYGIFAQNDDLYPTQKQLKNYLQKTPPNFADFTSKMMATLVDKAKGTTASGGYVIFVHFNKNDKETLIVAITNDKIGAQLRDGQLDQTTYLDLDGFRFAGRININKWQNHRPRYIDFLKGRGDVSEYFQRFLGCDTTTQAKKDTKKVIEVVKKFASDLGLSQEEKADFLDRAKTIGDRYASKKQEMTLEAFANELHPDDPPALLGYLTDENFSITGHSFQTVTHCAHSLSIALKPIDGRSNSSGVRLLWEKFLMTSNRKRSLLRNSPKI